MPVEDLAQKDRILAVSSELFHDHGYAAVGIRMIADAVGVRSSSLYHHFDSKEEILYSIVLKATIDFIDAQRDLFSSDQPEPVVMRSLIVRHVHYFYENRLAQQIALRDLRFLSPEHLEAVRKRRPEYRESLVELVRRGTASGAFAVADPVVATYAVLDMVNNFTRWFARSGAKPTRPRKKAAGGVGIDALAEMYADIVVDGVLQSARG